MSEAAVGQAIDLTANRAEALALTPVSRETEARLDRLVALLLDWQQRMNLIARSTEPIVWTRHVADSLQLLPLAPRARTWVDLGSGAGFPGVVIACALADVAGTEIHLVESNGKKASFLREAIKVTSAPATVHGERIDAFVKHAPSHIDVVTARALAPLPDLLTEAYPLLKRGALGLFPKGQDVDTELTQAAKCWNIQSAFAHSQTDPRSRIVIVQKAAPKL
ncbi:MAG TPA: 16S rRNA (guanine(527)-N(7))-methyltransferase RsmG [Xanthobacteraceae bacterium]|nr:16S rRNA (guanine(527)-N(7))-methyltransferase RsmG [Xanthobacteraceae bacterium]